MFSKIFPHILAENSFFLTNVRLGSTKTLTHMSYLHIFIFLCWSIFSTFYFRRVECLLFSSFSSIHSRVNETRSSAGKCQSNLSHSIDKSLNLNKLSKFSQIGKQVIIQKFPQKSSFPSRDFARSRRFRHWSSFPPRKKRIRQHKQTSKIVIFFPNKTLRSVFA